MRDKLEKLSSKALLEMRQHIGEILKDRHEVRLRVGAVGWFIASNGERINVRVVRINSKTVTCHEVGGPHRAWRVSPALLNFEADELLPRKVVPAPEASW